MKQRILPKKLYNKLIIFNKRQVLTVYNVYFDQNAIEKIRPTTFSIQVSMNMPV